jgi:Tfp pilus assembly protein PilO
MFNVISRYDRKELAIIITLIFFAMSALAFTYAVFPSVKTYRATTKIETTLSKVVENGDLLDNQLSQLGKDVASLERRIHGDMASLPEKEIESYVIGKLQRLSWQNNVQLIGIEPSVGETIESFRELLFRVNLSGDYHDMYQWLQDVSDELGFVLIKQYEMRPIDGTSRQPNLSVKLTMATYGAMQ